MSGASCSGLARGISPVEVEEDICRPWAGYTRPPVAWRSASLSQDRRTGVRAARSAAGAAAVQEPRARGTGSRPVRRVTTLEPGAVEAYAARVLNYEARTRQPPSTRGRRRPRRASRRRIRFRRTVALAVLTVVCWTFVSYVTAMLRPSNVGLAIRTVEWIRDHGGAWLVSDIEHAYYSNAGPSKGGKLRALPSAGIGDGVNATAAAYAPPAIRPRVLPPLPGEGVWHRTGSAVAGSPPVLVTTFRPDPVYPTLVAGVAWMDRTRVRLQLYPGRYEPPSLAVRGPMEVPPALRAGLLATFNSGFKLQDAGGGFLALGHAAAGLAPGLATLVGFNDGSFDVRAWSGPSAPGPQVAFARQNLRLIVDAGRLNPDLSDGPQWGATLGNATRVWRSGVGVDAKGNLIYAAADGQTVTSLARILLDAGAVRAMELDINSEWVTFNSYSAPGAHGATKLLPDMRRPADRYLTPDDRDFFAVTGRDPAPRVPGGCGCATGHGLRSSP
jgi:phosphodiester glycosidase